MKAGWTIGDGYSLGRHNAFDSANGSRLRRVQVASELLRRRMATGFKSMRRA